jgi:hypothetical protein
MNVRLIVTCLADDYGHYVIPVDNEWGKPKPLPEGVDGTALLPMVRCDRDTSDWLDLDEAFVARMHAMLLPGNREPVAADFATLRRLFVQSDDGKMPPAETMKPVLSAAGEALKHGNVFVH